MHARPAVPDDQGALSKTNPRGEIVLLESGLYDPATIIKFVTVVAPAGVQAMIAPASGDAITINVPPSASQFAVVLRNLHLHNSDEAQNGITFNSGEVLHVEGCVI